MNGMLEIQAKKSVSLQQSKAIPASTFLPMSLYRYIKNLENPKRWIRDEDTAQVVYEIGQYVVEGFGPTQIARMLKAREILVLGAYYHSKGVNSPAKATYNPYSWCARTVGDIMD